MFSNSETSYSIEDYPSCDTISSDPSNFLEVSNLPTSLDVASQPHTPQASQPPTPLEVSSHARLDVSSLPPTPLVVASRSHPPTPLDVSGLVPSPLELSSRVPTPLDGLTLPPTPMDRSSLSLTSMDGSSLPPTPMDGSSIPPTPTDGSIHPPNFLEISNSSFSPCQIQKIANPPKPLYQYKGEGVKNIIGKSSLDDEKLDLNEILSNVTLAEIESLNNEVKTKMAFLLGSSAFEEMRILANTFKLRESRKLDKLTLTPKEILETCNICDIAHSFFEGITRKSPRTNEEEDNDNIAQLHNSAFESLLKSINSKTIGIGSLKNHLDTVCASANANFTHFSAGGGKNVIKTLPLGDKLPLRKGSGLIVGDNSQFGIGKLQKHSRLKYGRSEANVKVVLHLVSYENESDEENVVFKSNEVAPFANDWHPLFRPVSLDFLAVFKMRIKMDEEIGHKVINVILGQFLSEMLADVKCGEGESTISKLFRLNQVNAGEIPKVCTQCHFVQNYKPDSDNSCQKCDYNPTVYKSSESPYSRFGLSPGKFEPVKSYEQEPLDINPSSYVSLMEMLDSLDLDQKLKKDECSAIGLDGLPGVRIKKLQTDFVVFKT